MNEPDQITEGDIEEIVSMLGSRAFRLFENFLRHQSALLVEEAYQPLTANPNAHLNQQQLLGASRELLDVSPRFRGHIQELKTKSYEH